MRTLLTTNNYINELFGDDAQFSKMREMLTETGLRMLILSIHMIYDNYY